MNARQLPPLTGIRFIAVTMVFLFHYDYGYGKVLGAVFHQFYLGVSVFFVLSGFLICYNYGKSVAINRQFLQRYYTNRLARIMPLYLVLTTFMFVVLYFGHEGGNHLFAIYLLNITFIKGFSKSFMFTGIYPAWSLTPEMTFYFLFPFIYTLISRFNWWAKQILFFWMTGLMLYLLFYLFPFKGFFHDLHFVIITTFFGRCLEFFLGMKLALLFTNRQVKTNGNSSVSTVPIYSIVGGTVAIAIIIIQAVISPDHAAVNYTAGLVLSQLAFPVAVTVLFFGMLTEVTWFSRLLSASLFQILGKSSYAFFLVHTGFIADWMFVLCRDNVLLVYLSVIIISIALYYFLENPLNRWIKGVCR
jgi:peptidoglycan/LPS O-acetylase OafA/YrhL